ncbi:hypothetical protein VTJ04DRAFT_9223 [Mycothermus thermophilus]|uniref:uncharacterized protein n=1 Tax=Humicola insolens TaxID=85995 RepID=UPI0037438896
MYPIHEQVVASSSSSSSPSSLPAAARPSAVFIKQLPGSSYPAVPDSAGTKLHLKPGDLNIKLSAQTPTPFDHDDCSQESTNP